MEDINIERCDICRRKIKEHQAGYLSTPLSIEKKEGNKRKVIVYRFCSTCTRRILKTLKQ